MKSITQTKLIIFISLFFTLFYNYTFFSNTTDIYPLSLSNFGFLFSIALILIAFHSFVFALIGSKYTLKPILIVFLLISSLTSYFMNTYGTIMDVSMIRNMMQTNFHESLDLLTIKQVAYFVFFGLIPAYGIFKLKLEERGLKKELFSKLTISSFASKGFVSLS